MSNADYPASPQTFAISTAGDIRSSSEYECDSGLTKREHFAGLALQGLCSNQFFNHKADEAPQLAVLLADALLSELDK